MQIIHIVPGSGGSFYCGNCLRDSKYIRGLKDAGAEVIKIPMYLPIFADEHDLEEIPVFYGAISLYLKHAFPFLRKAPSWLDKILNSGPMLKFAARMAGSTNPKGLEDMTISMLLGEQGEQKKELDHLVDWIAENCKADVIHLSNALLLGLARRIKEKLDVKVVCTLQDEDVWVNAMDENFKIKTWALMKERAKDVDAFFAVSTYFANFMKPLLNIPEHKLFIHHIGVDPEDYTFISTKDRPLHIGYISRMCEANGLEVLIDAFILLKKDSKWNHVNLLLTGGSTGDDDQFIKNIKSKINKAGIEKNVIFHDNFEEDGRHEFLKKISLVSVPVLDGEAFGLYLLESMASGVPVVQPSLGAFPEIIKKSGGGIIYQPNTAKDLAGALLYLLNDPEKMSTISKLARDGVKQNFNINKQALKTMALYQKIIKSKNKDSDAA
jgi:glycosyltransferase involved in cell wall biosynthesis